MHGKTFISQALKTLFPEARLSQMFVCLDTTSCLSRLVITEKQIVTYQELKIVFFLKRGTLFDVVKSVALNVVLYDSTLPLSSQSLIESTFSRQLPFLYFPLSCRHGNHSTSQSSP